MAMALKALKCVLHFLRLYGYLPRIFKDYTYIHTWDAPISNGLDFRVTFIPGLMIFANLPLSNLENSCPAPPFPGPQPVSLSLVCFGIHT